MLAVTESSTIAGSKSAVSFPTATRKSASLPPPQPVKPVRALKNLRP